jgi:chorismate mutase / prephenate dehydrogenase
MDDQTKKIIDICRKKIDAIDHRIFSLVKQREKLSAKIGHAKRQVSIPDRDFIREKAVFTRAIALAKELDLPTKLAIKLQKLFIEASLFRQEKDRIKNNFDQKKKSVLVVGGAGRLGKWLCHFFADSGHKISVVDLVHPGFPCEYSASIVTPIMQHDIIIVATPIRASIEILKNLGEQKLQSTVIFDVSSVKTPIYKSLLDLKKKGALVTSLHPMFGPSVELLFGKHIIRTSLGVKQADNLVDEIFKSTSLQVMDMGIDEHDSVIAILLSLSHLINIIFAKTLEKSSFSINFLERFSAPTFSKLISIAKQVVLENPHLYYEIQALNPHTKDVYQNVKDTLSQVIDAIQKFDELAFVTIMKQGEQFLSGQA